MPPALIALVDVQPPCPRMMGGILPAPTELSNRQRRKRERSESYSVSFFRKSCILSRLETSNFSEVFFYFLQEIGERRGKLVGGVT